MISQTELKQAKQQSQELDRTGELFNSLLSGEQRPEPPKSPPKRQPELINANNCPSAAVSEHLPPFYQPPAPPPSQPLPAKPHSMSSAPDSWPQFNLKRSETEKPTLFIPSSPSKAQPQESNILSLLEALKLARQEISTQGTRLKHLESALAHEKQARELAERRARVLSGEPSSPSKTAASEHEDFSSTFEPPLDSLELLEQDLPNGHIDFPSALNPSSSMETLKDASFSESSTTNLADRYDLLKLEFAQMKANMEDYKRRAEEAEASQRRFASLIDSSARSSAHEYPTGASGPGSVVSQDSTLFSDDNLDGHLATEIKDGRSLASPSSQDQVSQADAKLPPELERTLSTVLDAQRLLDQHHKSERWREGAPYASMVGVVLIGVGIMTWLNGWNKAVGGAIGGGNNVLD